MATMASGSRGEVGAEGAGPALAHPALHDGGCDGVQAFGALLELTHTLAIRRCSANV